MRRALVFCFFATMIMLASFAANIVAHEAVHLALSNEPKGVCFGVCEGNSKTPVAFAAAYADHNEASRGEFLPSVAGLAAAVFFSVIGTWLIVRRWN